MDIPPLFLPQEIIVPQPVQQVEENEQHNRVGSLPPENIAIENAVEPPQPAPLRRSQRERRPAITDDYVVYVVGLLRCRVIRHLVAAFYLYEGDSNKQDRFDQSKTSNYGHQYVEELEL